VAVTILKLEVIVALNLQNKQEIVNDLNKVAKSAQSAVVAENSGLTVEEMTGLRSEARKSGVYLRVVRNTLARRALQDTSFSCLNDTLVGPTCLAFSMEEPGAAAKLLRGFTKDHEKLKVKSLAIGGRLLGAEALEAIAKLPNREQALSILLGTMTAAIGNLVRTFAELKAKPVRVLAAIGRQK
jgi:large subunit ribosomal protein L10